MEKRLERSRGGAISARLVRAAQMFDQDHATSDRERRMGRKVRGVKVFGNLEHKTFFSTRQEKIRTTATPLIK